MYVVCTYKYVNVFIYLFVRASLCYSMLICVWLNLNQDRARKSQPIFVKLDM